MNSRSQIYIVLIAVCCAVLHVDCQAIPKKAARSGNDPGKSALAGYEAIFAGPLDLARAIEIAIANNPDVAAAGWEAEALNARYGVVAGERFPSLWLTGGYMHNLDPQRLLPVRRAGDPTTLSRDIATGDIVLTMPIFTGGRLNNQIQAADRLRDSAKHGVERSRAELVFDVSSLFFGLLSQEHIIEALESSRQALEQHVERINAMVEAEKAAPVDRMRTDVKLADVIQRLMKEQNTLFIGRRMFMNLLGYEGPSESLILKEDPERNFDPPVSDLESILAVSLERRPDYIALKASVDAQEAYVRAARAAYYPNVSLFGTYGERWALGDRSGTGPEHDDTGRIGVVVDMPLFTGGRTGAGVDVRRAELEAARQRLRKLEMQIRLDVEASLLNLESSRGRIEVTGKAIDEATESLRIEQIKYELGEGAIVDVLDAQAALLESKTNYHRALADYHTASAQLKLATGEVLLP